MKTDRLLFLLNVVSFLLLPGPIFSILTQLGVGRRVAWYWMWPLSCGYCYLVQAGSIGNDLFVTPFVLAAVHYALRSWRRRSIGDLCLSFLAAGMFTGVKANTVPLLLPYIIALAPSWRLALKHPISVTATGILALMVSFAPTAFFNTRYAGDWTGGEAKQLPRDGRMLSARLAGNSAILLINGLTPPIAPFAPWWNEHVAAWLGRQSVGKAIDAYFETGSTIFGVSELQVEEEAGLGFGIYMLIAATIVSTIWTAHSRGAIGGFGRLTVLFVLGTYFAFLVFVITSDVTSTARLLSPYYPLLLIPVLLAVNPAHVRRRWWKGLAMAGFLAAVLPIVFNPARPLFPWRASMRALRNAGCPEHLVRRAEQVYDVYSHRFDGFAPIKPLLPAEATVVGLVTYDDPEASLWRPFGSRRVIHVCHDDTSAFLRSEGLSYIVVSSEKFRMDFKMPLDQWLAAVNGKLLETVPLALRAAEGPTDWYVVKLN